MNDNHSPQPFKLDPAQGRALWHLGALLNFKALGAETAGAFWALEGLADCHMAVPLHAHSHEDELFSVYTYHYLETTDTYNVLRTEYSLVPSYYTFR